MAYASLAGACHLAAHRPPTEAEWAAAARRAALRLARAIGILNAVLGSCLDRPAPIGAFPHGATPDGLHDLNGNVCGWTASLTALIYVPGDGREEPARKGCASCAAWFLVCRGPAGGAGAYRLRVQYSGTGTTPWGYPCFQDLS